MQQAPKSDALDESFLSNLAKYHNRQRRMGKHRDYITVAFLLGCIFAYLAGGLLVFILLFRVNDSFATRFIGYGGAVRILAFLPYLLLLRVIYKVTKRSSIRRAVMEYNLRQLQDHFVYEAPTPGAKNVAYLVDRSQARRLTMSDQDKRYYPNWRRVQLPQCEGWMVKRPANRADRNSQ